jgi:uncharacterized protein YfiM (DUF2279 family)
LGFKYFRYLFFSVLILTACALPCRAEETAETAVFPVVKKTSDAWFAKDKAQHFTLSFLSTGALSYLMHAKWNRCRPEGVKWGIGLTLSLGIFKEIRDIRYPKAQASLKDLFADGAGVACGILLLSWW